MSMSIQIDWDEGALHMALQAAAADGVERIGREVQALFDEVYAAHARGERGAVRRALAEGAVEAGLTFSDEQLDGYAEAIAEGRRIHVETSTEPA
jgi:hypothetical protein